ncbi:hypothetical protein HNE_2753 [Hyphomonas neptunium ATCC 15444]|uniref:Uncharacterized protein n=3 Tax=Hyphomonas TaxID=85 RepID=Q0BYL1_HYPNA|nr:hypothetical protein HNE_2753 [Hyphomonas neptunium ATCC 15444]
MTALKPHNLSPPHDYGGHEDQQSHCDCPNDGVGHLSAKRAITSGKPAHKPRPIHPPKPHTSTTTRPKSPHPIRPPQRSRYPHAMDYAFATPLPGLSLLQRLLWPLIFVQLIALRDWVRAHYGRGVPYWITISKFGRVRLRHLPADFASSQAAPVSYEIFGQDYSAGLTRDLLAATCAEEETSGAPAPALSLALPETQSGQAPSQKGRAHPDTS